MPTVTIVTSTITITITTTMTDMCTVVLTVTSFDTQSRALKICPMIRPWVQPVGIASRPIP